MDLFTSDTDLKSMDPTDSFDYEYKNPGSVDSDGSVIELEFDDYDIELESKAVFLARLEDDERTALASLTKLQSTEFAENQPAEPELELLSSKNIITSSTETKHESNLPPEDPSLLEPLQRLAHIQSSLQNQRALHTSLLTTIASFSLTLSTLNSTLVNLRKSLATNTSIYHKLTQTTETAFTSLHATYSSTLKGLRLGLDREGRKRVELILQEEALNARIFDLGRDVNSMQMRHRDECDRVKGVEEWLRVHEKHDLQALAQTKLKDLAESKNTATDNFRTLTLMAASQKSEISSLTESIADLSKSILINQPTLTNLTTSIESLTAQLKKLSESLPETLASLESKIVSQLSKKARLTVKHESGEARIEILRVYVSGLKGEMKVYREDMVWLAGAIEKVERKIVALESVETLTVQDIPEPHHAYLRFRCIFF